MDSLKKYLKRAIPRKVFQARTSYKDLALKNVGKSKTSLLLHGKIVLPNDNNDYLDDYVRQFCRIVDYITLDVSNGYIYPYSSMVLRVINRQAICSVTVDYSVVLNSDLNDIRFRLTQCKDLSFKNRELGVVDGIERFAKKVGLFLSKSNDSYSQVLKNYFPRLVYERPSSLNEAIQKILFYNALFWQMGHYHIGLGRLDIVLYDYYEKDVNDGIITQSQAKDMICRMLLVLGKDTHAKSATLLGDTGQYILLGGIDEKGKTVNNKLTELFLEIMTELKVPDPKLILRVNTKTDYSIWKKSIECVCTGIGSPLLLNEDLIMKSLVDFGYDRKDVWNFGTSACWEPLIIGKSFDQNNPFMTVVALKPLNEMVLSNSSYLSFNDFLTDYKVLLSKEIRRVVKDIRFDCSPLFSLFFSDCINREKDFTDGGAEYAYHGVQIVSLPNAVNALLNIKRLVFQEKKCTLKDLCKGIVNNFSGEEALLALLKDSGKKFGQSDDEVINLTNELMTLAGDSLKNIKCNGCSLKIGFSSPSYIGSSKEFMASCDGRKKGEPFAVHISPDSSNIDILELFDFASHLNYNGNRINGNVVDFILPYSYVDHVDKFIAILKDACSKGVYEIQLNVLDKRTLIDAKAHPEKYPNLVVRVWGFSAYFRDLPDDFKDNLIKRAYLYEGS